MTIIVTGGAGFIGSNFVFHMLKEHPDYRIVCLDKLTYAGNLSTMAPVMDNPNFRFVKADICDREAVEALGVEIISRPVATVENGLVRHNPGHLAWELVQLHNQRNIRLVCRDSHRTTCNRVET